VIAQDEAITTVLACRTVSLDVAAAAIPMGRNKAHRHARERGYVVPGVPVIPLGDWGYVVPTPALRRVLQLEGSPLGLHTRLTQGGNGDGDPRLGSPSSQFPLNPNPAKGEVRVDSTRNG
jgi:hypothetical protein